jgi:hypothetical protein
VNLTVEFNDLARIAVGLHNNGLLAPASRVECREWAMKMLTHKIANEQQVIQLAVDQLRQEGFEPVTDAELTG